MSDTHNPYAAPQASVEPASYSDFEDGPPAPWATGEVLSQSWELFKQHWAPLLGALVIGYVVLFGVQTVFSVLAGAIGGRSGSPGLAIATAIVSMVISMVAQAAVSCGWARMFLMTARGETPVLGVLFSSVGLMPQMLIATVILTIGYLLGILLLVVPGVIFMIGTIPYLYFIADGESGVESVRKSWEATRGQKVAIFVFLLALAGINIVGMLACGLGMLVTLPVSMLALAVVYTRLTGRFGPRDWAAV